MTTFLLNFPFPTWSFLMKSFKVNESRIYCINIYNDDCIWFILKLTTYTRWTD